MIIIIGIITNINLNISNITNIIFKNKYRIFSNNLHLLFFSSYSILFKINIIFSNVIAKKIIRITVEYADTIYELNTDKIYYYNLIF